MENRIKVTCEWCGKKFAVPPSQPNRRFCSSVCSGKGTTPTGSANPLFKPTTTIICEECHTPFEVKPHRVGKARFCSFSCRSISRQRSNPRISSIEITVAEELTRRNLLFDGQVRVGLFVPDFIVGNTIIEVDGDYWHNRPDIAERDLRKNAFYEESGFDVIRIWEHEILAGDFSKLDVLQSVA
jgi:very-short-patch-repair endonuclease